ncbi:hypothetical protein KHA80_10965 [Anaerobacillus sp. HL2]|nr:hypothetical protein KHA80_10965 [Anaerobacillus sp. HL2]
MKLETHSQLSEALRPAFSKEESGTKKVGHFELIIKEIDRVNHFISDLLNIASPNSSGEYKNTNIVTLLENLLTLQKSVNKEKEHQVNARV